jgi:signal transduction histidine kinase
LASLTSEVVSDAEFSAQERKRSVRLTSKNAIYVTGNRDLLRSAIENILLNAVRYTPQGSSVDVGLRYEATLGSAVLEVRDYGPGVPENELTNIFRPFYRVSDARDQQSGGVGLGLAITDRVVRLHGGSVSAANAAGGGLEVQIRIPVAADSQQAHHAHLSKECP